jgi:hypothetical protein
MYRSALYTTELLDYKQVMDDERTCLVVEGRRHLPHPQPATSVGKFAFISRDANT